MACGNIIVLAKQNLHVMPQVTLSVPNEKLPLLKDVLSALGIENKKRVATSISRNPYRKVSTTFSNASGSLFKKYFGWEYYSNELEFE